MDPVSPFRRSAEVKLQFARKYRRRILEVGRLMSSALKRGNKILLFGNGGSAADAQHIAAEIVGRYGKERKGLPAVALTTDTSILTAVGNDYGFERIFERQIEALCREGDVVIGITTSGNSENVVRALRLARNLGAVTVAFTGGSGGRVVEVAQYSFVVPSSETPRIQECHITLGHVLCEVIEEML